jgi:type IV pilus assembly protein PilX
VSKIMRNSIHSVRHQRGAILVTSLLLLLVLTVLGVAMMKMTNMQERMAGNTRDLNLALQASEAALRDGETRISKLPASWDAFTANAGCTYCQKYWLPVDLDDPSKFNWPADAQEFGVAGTKEFSLAEDPRFTVEDAGWVGDSILVDETEGRRFFSITARSTGATGQANTVLQSTYARRF